MHNSKITLAISDQRKHFYQWDTGRKLIVTGLEEGSQIHFHREGMEEPYTLLVYAGEDSTELFCNVPDEMLQEAKSFTAYTYVTDKDGGKTCSRKNFSVEEKPKPSDYVYTETEIKSWNDFYKRLDELELGARAVIDVEALPEDAKDINTALLYRTAEGVYWYDGSWHKVIDESDLSLIDARISQVESIAKGAGQAVSYGNYSTMIDALNVMPRGRYRVGQSVMIVTVDVPDLWVSAIGEESTEYTYTSDEDFVSALKSNGSVKVGFYQLSQLETQKVDLTDYVKNTDYATGTKAGVMKVPGNTGVYMYEGKLWLRLATNYEIKNKTNYFAITPERLDYAMKIGLTTNSETLTDEEKASALAWLGAVSDTDVEYTCDKYNHQALIEGYLPDWYGYAASDVLTADDLSDYEIDVECDESYGSVHGTVSLAGARVITLDGGYALSVAPSGVSSSCPDARVIVVTDTEKFNKMCSCDLESVGIYLSNTQVDNDVMQMTYQTKVTALRATTAKISNAHLYLEGHPLIKSLMAKIEALEKKA